MGEGCHWVPSGGLLTHSTILKKYLTTPLTIYIHFCILINKDAGLSNSPRNTEDTMFFSRDNQPTMLRRFNNETLAYAPIGNIPCQVSGLASHQDDYFTGYRPLANGQFIAVVKLTRNNELISEDVYKSSEPINKGKDSRECSMLEIRIISELLLAA